ncbi:helix-turn-helix transcriptional regulator [Salimicrobium album]|uniref:Helix-turn-helix n=1 Tax=Salimicrobium album TaxID=50717 RepID=A0A1H3DCF4_9BACI|nr:helix-turn-helix transcriptional regulator [Salimicrobium album]SDX64056.1 Helix-turn-helix [Salimicrobium album]
MTNKTDFPQISLKAARANAGMSIAEASKALGISHTTLVKWERRPGDLTPNQQKKIEEVYQFPTDYIFFGD